MADPKNIDAEMEDDYDEEADSDFQTDADDGGELSSSSDEDAQNDEDRSERPRKKRKIRDLSMPEEIGKLDSGDEATIKERKKSRRKKKQRGEDARDDSEDEPEGWRAKTRAMREREKDEKKRNKLATSKGSTIDVDKIWEQMNQPRPLPPPRIEGQTTVVGDAQPPDQADAPTDNNKENMPTQNDEEMITIRRAYKFAGEVHVEEKIVPKSSAEARLWLSQQSSRPDTQALASDGRVVQRPLRKISRFDPNYHNLDAFQAKWNTESTQEARFKGPKLNVVEKSKMDWAVHVDTEGLKDELDEHAKAKEGYLNRMDFLNEVQSRKEAEARAARLKGQ